MECDQLALSQSADQLQIEHRQGITPLGGVQIRADVVWVKDFHLLFFNFGDDAILRRIGENEFFFHRPVKGIVQHHVDASHSGIAQSGFFLFLYFPQPPIALQIVVELLQVTGGELIQRDIPDSRDDMLFDVPVVVVHGGWANVRFGIQFKPRPQPSGNRVFIGAADVQ